MESICVQNVFRFDKQQTVEEWFPHKAKKSFETKIVKVKGLYLIFN